MILIINIKQPLKDIHFYNLASSDITGNTGLLNSTV